MPHVFHENPCHRIVHIAYTTGSGSRRSGYITTHESAGCVAGNVHESQAHTVLGQRMFRPIEKSFRSNEVDSMKDCEAMINQSCEANDTLRICWHWVEWDVFLAKFFQLKASHVYKHFSASTENPSTVTPKRCCDRVADSLLLLKLGVTVMDIINAGRLVILTTSGISEHRLQYQQREIKQYLRPDSQLPWEE